MSIGDYVSSIAWTLPLLVLPLASAEHHGRVKFGGVPIPGVTVTASQADKKVSTITDAQGLYSFPDIAEGSWTIKVEMQGFSPAEKDVAVASGGPGADWELKMLRLDEMNAQAQPGSVSLTLNVPVATPSSAQSNKKAERPPANSENFQSTDLNAVNPTVDLSAPASEAFRDLDPRDLSQRAADSFLVNGMVNNAAASPFSQSTAFGNARRSGSPLYNGNLGVILGNNQEPVNWGPPALLFSSGIASLTDAQYSLVRNQTSGLSLDVAWGRSHHNLFLGGFFRKQQFNLLSQEDPRGTFAFTGVSTSASANGVPIADTGSDFAGFLLGIPDTSSIAFGNADKYFRASLAAIYVSDDWRIHPGLTLNWGLRWEYSSPITELYGRLVNLDIAPGFAAVAAVVAANPVGPLTGQTYPNSLIHPDRNNLAPRVGFAWRPFSASSMVVRGGYGIYYDTSVYHPIATLMAQQSPLSTSLRVENSPSNPLTLADGFKASSEITENTFALDPRLRIGYSQNWQLSVQRDLPRGRGGRTE